MGVPHPHLDDVVLQPQDWIMANQASWLVVRAAAFSSRFSPLVDTDCLPTEYLQF
jgi:hypothetical protein